MARITVEDCIDKFPSRFELVLVASQRAKSLYSGETPTVDKDNDKNTVIALREIADETLTVDQMKENLIQEYQVTTIIDEENENLDIESDDKEKEIIDKTNNNQASEIEKEISELGGSISSSVSKKTNYLIAGSDPGIKLNNAINLKVTILNENEFRELINRLENT